MHNVTPILELLDKQTGTIHEKDPAKRAAIIASENLNPVTMAHKEKAARELLQKWEQWGIIKLTGEGEQA